MAITNAQRTEALQAITFAAVQGDAAVAALLPGTTAAQVWAFLVTAIGTTADAPLTTVLGSQVASLNAQLATEQGRVTALQGAITAATVQ